MVNEVFHLNYVKFDRNGLHEEVKEEGHNEEDEEPVTSFLTL